MSIYNVYLQDASSNGIYNIYTQCLLTMSINNVAFSRCIFSVHSGITSCLPRSFFWLFLAFFFFLLYREWGTYRQTDGGMNAQMNGQRH